MIKNNFRILFALLIMITATSQSQAGEVFRYKFENDTAIYDLTIESQFQFPYLEGLAELLDIDSLKHDFDMSIKIIPLSKLANKGAVVKVVFDEISSVTTVGDSLYTYKDIGWGKVKPGAVFLISIYPRGEISLLSKGNLKAGKQVVDMMQRFMPVFPEPAIAQDYTWSDTIGFDLELPEQDLKKIETVVGYTYIGKDKSLKTHKFDYRLRGAVDDSVGIALLGTGQLNFDNKNGRIVENQGVINIDTEISLSTFGLPEMLGTTPVHIDSKIKLVLITDE